MTSIINTLNGVAISQAAKLAEDLIERTKHYDTITLTDLESWPAGDLLYEDLQPRQQKLTAKNYTHLQRAGKRSPQQFDDLLEGDRDALARRLARSTHSSASHYTRRSYPETARKKVLDTVNNIDESEFVPGAEGSLVDFYSMRLDASDTDSP